MAVFQPFEILAHVFSEPRRISRNLGQVVPVTVLRNHGDHGIVSRAASQRSRSWIPDPVAIRDELAVFLLFLLIRVMPHVVVPGDLWILGGKAVKNRDFVHVPAEIAFRAWIGAGLEKKYVVSLLCQIRSQGTAPCPGSYDDVIVCWRSHGGSEGL